MSSSFITGLLAGPPALFRSFRNYFDFSFKFFCQFVLWRDNENDCFVLNRV